MAKNRVDVAIDGQIITLVSEETEEHLRNVAEYIDKKLSEFKSAKSSRPISDSLKTMHIAANIADDYFKTLHDKQKLEETHRTYVVEMGQMQEENLLLMDRIHDLQAQLTLAMDQFKTELLTMSKETTFLEEKVTTLESEKQNYIAQIAELANANQSLEEQLQQAKSELDEYISTFDDREDIIEEKKERLNVVNFSKY